VAKEVVKKLLKSRVVFDLHLSARFEDAIVFEALVALEAVA
jgi:hypothetical protein